MGFIHPAVALFWALAAVPAVAAFGYSGWVRRRAATGPVVAPPEPAAAAASGAGERPTVAVIVAAFDERDVIAARIENLLASDYPPDRLTVWIATDGSTDGTDALVERAAASDGRVNLVRSEGNFGKMDALNRAVAAARAAEDPDILAFSDANTSFDAGALAAMVRWFANPAVGCVCGRLAYEPRDNIDGQSAAGPAHESAYWNWDTDLRAAEGRTGEMLGGTGAVMALRAPLAVALPPDHANDMLWPIVARRRGWAAVFAGDAIARERAAGDALGEFRRKSRIVAQGLRGVARGLWIVVAPSPVDGPVPVTSRARVRLAGQLVAKKLCRYLSMPALVGMVLCGAFLPGGISLVLARLLALAMVATAAAAIVMQMLDRPPAGRLDPRYAAAVAAAGLVGTFRFLTGEGTATWRSVRD